VQHVRNLDADATLKEQRMTDFATMTGPQLVAIWNEMALTATDLGLPEVKSVKKFKDHKAGVARCTKLHAQIQAARPGIPAHDLGLPEFLDRSKNGIKPAPIPEGPVRSSPPPLAAPEKKRDWRIPKGMSDEEGAAMLAAQAEEKKTKAAARITLMKEKQAERDAEKLATVNTKREASGLPPLTSLNEKLKPHVTKQKDTKTMAKKTTKKTVKAKAKATNGSGKWMSDDATITKLEAGKDYEPRKGSTSAKLWDLIANNMKVGVYKEKGKAPAMPYLRWFMAHGYVKVNG
jgi:hypothetical protein